VTDSSKVQPVDHLDERPKFTPTSDAHSIQTASRHPDRRPLANPLARGMKTAFQTHLEGRFPL
jgi:hypothetical protein